MQQGHEHVEPDVTWRKSAHSGAQGNCVELAAVASAAAIPAVAVRNSRYPTGPVLVFTAGEMGAFLADIKDGGFDDLLPAECR